MEQPRKTSPWVNSPRDDKGWNRPLLHNSYVKCCRKGLKWAVIKAPLKPRACVFPQILMFVTVLDFWRTKLNLNHNLWLPWQSKRVCWCRARQPLLPWLQPREKFLNCSGGCDWACYVCASRHGDICIYVYHSFSKSASKLSMGTQTWIQTFWCRRHGSLLVM